MASRAPDSSWRAICAQHLGELAETLERHVEAEVQSRVSIAVNGAIETAVVSAVNRSRRELSEQLNQAVRQLRHWTSPRDFPMALAAAAAPFAEHVAAFRIHGDVALAPRPNAEWPNGAPSGGEDGEWLEVALAAAPAFRAAIESRDPVVAMGSEREVSARVVEVLGQAPDEKVYLFPVISEGQVTALLCASGAAHTAALELLAGVGSLHLDSLNQTVPPQPPGLVTISNYFWKQPQSAAAMEQPQETPKKSSSGKWGELTPKERELHLAAQRFSRVQVAEMRLNRLDTMRGGRARHELYRALKDSIDPARDEFRRKFIDASPTMVDYLHLELLRSLADHDPQLFGHDYPGPMA